MLFRNLILFRLAPGWSVSVAALEQTLAARVLQPCGTLEMERRGWVPPGPDDRMVHTINGQQLIALGIHQKILPPSVVRETTVARAAELQKTLGTPLGRRSMRELKDRVRVELCAKAFTRMHVTHVWIDAVNGWLVIGASSTKRAEAVVEMLREALGSVPATLPVMAQAPAQAMAEWVHSGEAPLHFNLETDLELQTLDGSKSTVRYTRHELDGRDIREHIEAGKTVNRLGLTWNDQVTFILTKSLALKRLTFLGLDKSTACEKLPVCEADRFAAEITLMTGELSQLLTDLEAAFEADPQEQALAA